MMESKEYFKDVASQWDTMRKGFFSDDIREKACSVADVRKGKVAADIGAGTGFISEGLLNHGLKVIAVDNSKEMLEQMEKKFGAASDIDYRLGESDKLPIDDGAVDYAMANMVLHHVETPFTTIEEMVRILKPGGKLVITDLDEHNHEFLRTEQHDFWMGFKREDVKSWFTKAGLKNVTVECAGGNCCSKSECGCDSASISIFVACGEK
jgi:ubiquinone/menaquinone biosynthesis C-methylase UbiE